MSTRPKSGRRTRRATGAGVALGLAAAALVGAGPAHSVPADPSCPAAFPVADLVRDQPVDGLTVSQGTVPDTFTGAVLGVITDGIAPGVDMIIVRLTSAEIDRVGGIWAGMSGSPVYAADGRLIGAVSYGLAFGPSPVAGVTAAADMQELLALTTGPAALPRTGTKVAVPRPTARRIVAAGDATAEQVGAGLTRLPLPMAISGMVNASRVNQAAKLLGLDDVRYYRAGPAVGAAAAAAAGPEDIVAGGNVGASLSYGDVSAVGIGTVTAVCPDGVLAFGHPMAHGGPTTLTMHPADAIYIQEDPTVAPFKVANPGAPAGVFDQDRITGIKGVLGTLPDTTAVATTVAVQGGGSRVGTTEVSLPGYLPDASALGLLANQDRVFDRIAGGSALVSFDITGHTAGGAPFSLVRTNRYESGFDLSFETIFELASDVAEVVQNEFTEVTVDQVSVSSTLSEDRRKFHIGKVEQRRNGAWRTIRDGANLTVTPGHKIRLRVTMPSFRDAFGTKVRRLSVLVPASTPVGSFGDLFLAGGLDAGFGGDGEGGFVSGPESFDELLTSLAEAPRNDELVATTTFFPDSGPMVTVDSTRQVNDVLGGSRSYGVRITG